MGNWISAWIDQMSYFGVALLMFLENVFPPIPSELIIPLSAFVAKQGKMTLWGVVLAAVLGSCLGQIPLYYLGRFIGEDRLERWFHNHPWAAVSSKEFCAAMKWFDRYGSKAIFFCRLVPGLRSLISIPAGICGMSLPRFLLYTSMGTLLWTLLLAWAGWSLGEKHATVAKYIDPISAAVLLSILAFYLWRVARRFYRLRQERNTGT